MDEICYNALALAMRDDPRVNFDTHVDNCPGYKFKQSLGDAHLPEVCGNCEWYSVQGKEEDLVPA